MLGAAIRLAVAAPGDLTETGTFVNANLYRYTPSGDGQILFSAGKAGTSTAQGVTINANQTGVFSSVLATAPSTFNSNYSRVSRDGRLGAAVTLTPTVSLSVDLFDIASGGGSISRLGPWTTSVGDAHMEVVKVEPLHRYAAVQYYELAKNGAVTGYITTVYPSGTSVNPGTSLSNRDGFYYDFDFSPDGSKLALAEEGRDSVILRIFSVNPSNAALTEVASHTHSVALNSRAAVAFSPDGAGVYLAVASDGALLAFDATQTGNMTPLSTDSNSGLVESGAMKVGGSTLGVVGLVPSDLQLIGVNLYTVNANKSLTYRGTFIPETSKPPLLVSTHAERDCLAISEDGALGALLYRINDGNPNATSRLYSFNASAIGDNATALDSLVFSPGGPFTTMELRASASGTRLVAFAAGYSFGTAHIVSMEPQGGASPTPTPTVSSTPTPTASLTPTPTSSLTPTPTASLTPSPTASLTPSPTASLTPSPTASLTPSPTASLTPSPTASLTPSLTPTATATPTATSTATPTATPTASLTPTPTATAATPSPTPTAGPTPRACGLVVF